MSWYRWDGTSLVLRLQIQPGARRSEFADLHGERLKVRIHAPAIEGRANTELQSFLCSRFTTSKNCIHIEHGTSGRMKSVRIHAPVTLPGELLSLGLTTPSG